MCLPCSCCFCVCDFSYCVVGQEPAVAIHFTLWYSVCGVFSDIKTRFVKIQLARSMLLGIVVKPASVSSVNCVRRLSCSF